MKAYTLIAFGKRIPVTKEVYQAYYQAYEKERYQNQLALTHTLSMEKLHDLGMPIEAHQLREADSIEALLEKKDLKEALHHALGKLDKDARKRFILLALGEATERSLAERYQMSKSSVHREKLKSAKLLRDYLDDSLK